MLIKHQAVKQQMQRKIAPLYVLIGQDTYLMEEALTTIKSTLKQSRDCDEKVITIQSTEDWNLIVDEANSYSLFSDTVLLNLIYEKKTLEAAGKKVLTEYLKSTNSRCIMIIRAPNIPAKQIQWLTDHESVVVVVSYSLSTDAMLQWISMRLKELSFNFNATIPALIHQYTQGNMLACAQVIEKISLTNNSGSEITRESVLEHLSNQSEHSLYELVDACLLGQTDKAIQIIRQAAQNKTEPTLVLWMLAQEVRNLERLTYLIHRNVAMKTACTQLKIWPQRASFYQAGLRRINTTNLLPQLLSYCQIIDERIKSNASTQAWNSLECLVLSIAQGTPIGDLILN